MKTIVLSRRNLLTLLSKLDRVRDGEESACTLIKSDGTIISAEEDSDHYANRTPGSIHPRDEELLPEIAAKYTT